MTKSLTIIKRSSPPCPMCEMLEQGLIESCTPYTAIDITDNPDIVEEYDITSIPVTLIKDGSGEVVELINGFVAAEMLAEIIKEETII